MTPNLWASLVVTAVTAILNAVFISTVLAHKSSFMLYLASPKRGTSTTLLDIADAALMTSAWVAISVVVTLLVALLVFLKQRDWLRIIVMIQILFTGIGVSSIVSSVIRIQAGTEIISYVAGGAVVLLTAFAAVYYVRALNPLQSKRFNKKQR